MPELSGEPRKTAAEILNLWPSATMIVDGTHEDSLYIVPQQWYDALLKEPPAPTPEDLAEYEMTEEEWYDDQQTGERRLTLHQVTDEWMPAEVAERFGQPDKGYGVDYWPAEYLYPRERQEEIEQALRDLGFTVIRNRIGDEGGYLDRWRP